MPLSFVGRTSSSASSIVLQTEQAGRGRPARVRRPAPQFCPLLRELSGIAHECVRHEGRQPFIEALFTGAGGSGCGRATFFHADVPSEAQMKALVSFAEASFGHFGVLVNNASAPHGDEGIGSWVDAIETDLLGAAMAEPS